MHSFIPSTIRRYRNQRHLTLETFAARAPLQRGTRHLLEWRPRREWSIERIADEMGHIFQRLGRRRGA